MTFLQLSAFAVCGLIFSIILKNMNSSISTMLIAAVMLVIAVLVVSKLESMIVQLQQLIEFAAVNKTYISLLFKIIGITYITHFTAALFKDQGHTAAAGLLEVLCRISVATLSLPIVLSLFETVARCI